MTETIFKKQKSDSDELDYSFNYAAADGTNTAGGTGFLQGDTITTSTWTIEGNDAILTLGTASKSNTATSTVLVGGTEGLTYRVKNLILTVGGDKKERTLHIEIVNI